LWPDIAPFGSTSSSSLSSLPLSQDFSFGADLLLPDQEYSPFLGNNLEFSGAYQLDAVDDSWDNWLAVDNTSNDMMLTQYTTGGSLDASLFLDSNTCEMPDTTTFFDARAVFSESTSSDNGKFSPEMASMQDTFQPSPPPPTTSNHSPAFVKSPHSTHSPSKSPTASTPSSSTNTQPSKVQKRTLNTLAARRYRQKRVDQVSSLETSLKETQDERDELKLKVARLEAEVGVLRGLVGRK